MTLLDQRPAVWQSEGGCRRPHPDVPPDGWYDPQARHLDAALKVCESCPVRRRCAEEGLDVWRVNGVLTGIWGGVYLTGSEAKPSLRSRLYDLRKAAS